MERKVTCTDALQMFSVSAESAADDIKSAGITAASMVGSTQFQTYSTVIGITPDEFLTKYKAVEFNYDELRTKFAMYCKDYRTPIESEVCSKALEFSHNMLFKVGPNLRNEKKSKGVKMARFRFPYEKTVENTKSFDIKTVIVCNYKEHNYIKKIGDGTLILTFEQAGLLAIDIFIDVIRYVCTKTQQYPMTPLCGAIFSRDSIIPMSEQLKLSETEVTIIINASTCSGGQYLEESDMACAIVAAICATKRMSNLGARHQIITKIVKQYAARKKQYLPERFNIFSVYALGGVPPGMDANMVIENYYNNEAIAVNKRVAILASKETMLASKSVGAGLSASGASGSRCQW